MQRELCSILIDDVSLFSSVGKLQLPRDHSASRHRPSWWPCPVPSLLPALLLVPSPPSECVSVTQRRCEAEGPSGGAAAAAASTSSTSRAARSDLPRAHRERTTKRALRLSLRPRLLSTRLRGQLPSRGLVGWRGRRRQNAALSFRAPRVRTLHPLAPDLGAVLGLRPPAIVR